MGDQHHPLLCDANDAQLVVVDIQERLAGAMPEQPRQQLIRNTTILVQAAGLLDIPLNRTEQYPKGLGDTLAPIAAQLPATHWYGEKTCFACTGASGFGSRLGEGGKQIVLAGMETHVCVLQTAMTLHANGFQVFVVEDACCSRYKQHHFNALERLRHAGVIVSNTESVLFEWLRDSSHPQFKTIAALIR
jgi:nicotinamidase-related amidase